MYLRIPNRKKVFVLLSLFILLTLIAACGGQTSSSQPSGRTTTAAEPAVSPSSGSAAPPSAEPSSESAPGNYRVETLKLEGGTDWGAPSPYLNASRGPGEAKMRLVFASLLEEDENGDAPWLAESWKIDGNDYTFTLFEGTAFHDGKPLTAEDVAFSLDYYKAYPPVSNTLGAGDGFIADAYQILDSRTITVTVPNPNADTLVNLGGFPIIPKHIWEDVEDPAALTGGEALIGSGPYMSTGYDGAGGSYEFTAFEGWVNGKQAAKRILFVPVSDPLLAFENGEVDIISMPADLMDKYLNDPEIGVVNKANDMGYKLLINFEKRPDFLDKELRAALYRALDRQAVVDKVFRGAGSVGSAGYVPEGSVYYNPDCVKYDYDPDAAATAFQGKGYSVSVITADSADDISIAELIKLDLEAAGMTVDVAAYDSVTRDDMVNSGDYEFALVGNGGWGNNPPVYMRTVFSDISKNKGGNPHNMGPIGYGSAPITELAESQANETDFNKRVSLFKELQLLVSQEIPLIVVANRSSYSMFRKNYYDGWMKTYAYQQAEQNRLSFMDRS